MGSGLGISPVTGVGVASPSSFATGNTNATDATWHHIAASFDGAVTRVYLDGALVAQTSEDVPSVAANGTFVIGGSLPGLPFEPLSFSGSSASSAISDIRVYARALSPSEILDLSAPSLPSRTGTRILVPPPGATSYTYVCAAGNTGSSGTYSRNPLTGSWSFLVEPSCTACPNNTYAFEGSPSCSPCATGDVFVSSTRACAPGPTSTGPLTQSFISRVMQAKVYRLTV